MADKCQICGKPYEQKEISALGKTVSVSVPQCDCEKEKKEKEKLAIENQKKHDKVMEFFRWCDIGERLQDCWFENFEPKDYNRQMFEFAKKYVVEFEAFKAKGIGAVFIGPVGVGKTHLAVSIFREIMMKNYTSIFVRFTDLITKMEEARSYTVADSVSGLVNFFNRADFCVLDDVGSLRASDTVRDFLYKIIDGRYQHKKPTFITTNYDETMLKTTLGDRIYDRILGCSVVVSADGPSERSVKRGVDLEEIMHSIRLGESEPLIKKKAKFDAFTKPQHKN